MMNWPMHYSRYSVADISDVLDSMGLTDQVLSLTIRCLTVLPMEEGRRSIVGYVYPVQGEFSSESGLDPVKIEAIESMPAHSVAIWSMGSPEDIHCCAFGGLLARRMHRLGIIACVVEGRVRDVHEIRGFGFPVFAWSATPVQSHARWRVRSHGTHVRLASAAGGFVEVARGDLVVADEDGILVVPQEHVAEVAVAVNLILEKEASAIASVDEGLSLSETYQRHGRL
jgi:4-hydroxy-4-methyl-2-oxoglutarate aldolase